MQKLEKKKGEENEGASCDIERIEKWVKMFLRVGFDSEKN